MCPVVSFMPRYWKGFVEDVLGVNAGEEVRGDVGGMWPGTWLRLVCENPRLDPWERMIGAVLEAPFLDWPGE